jgi:hypothetical protein
MGLLSPPKDTPAPDPIPTLEDLIREIAYEEAKNAIHDAQ